MFNRILIVLLALLALAGCAPEYSNADPLPRAFEALEEWDNTVGVVRPGLTIAVREGSPNSDGKEFRQGEAKCEGATATITLFRGTFEASEFDAEVRHVMLHELVHAHKCQFGAHSTDPAALMYPEVNDENLGASVSDADATWIREAWIRSAE